MPRPISFERETDDGWTEELLLPTRWEICDTCDGEGARALGGLAITASEWAEWDLDEREAYCRGDYDSTCEACGGSGKIRVVDEKVCDPDVLAAYHEHLAQLAQYEAEERAERRMGA